MKISIVQSNIFWEDRDNNLNHFSELIDEIEGSTDLIILPEMFTTGFSMNPKKIAEPSIGPSLLWMKEKAKEKKCVITGSVAVEESGKFFNRLFWVDTNGEYNTYDKRHLFRMAKEEQHYTAGEKTITAKIKNWNFRPLICYDLRFPVWSRNKFKIQNPDINKDGEWDYDVLIYVANWPEVRSYPWKQLLIARAIENQCYVIGVNRIGEDGNGFKHSGDSVVINPKGEIISTTKPNVENIETVILDKNYLDEFRKTFPVGLDADSFSI